MTNEKSAILIIDMINDFVSPGGALVMPRAVEIIKPIKQILQVARGYNLPIYLLNDAHDEDDYEFKSWRKHGIKGTWGAQITPELSLQPKDIIIEKTRYSGFYNTKLGEILAKEGIKRTYLAGVASSICVLSTALDSKMRDISTTVISDLTRGINDEDHKAVDIVGRICGINYKTLNEVLEEIKC